MADILRLAEPSRLISAAVFEEIFDCNHARWFDCTRQSHVSFFNDVLGSIKKPYSWQKALEGFNQATAGYDFICPGFQMTLMIPLLLHLRNQAGSDVRLLFINHSPGVFAYVFGLLSALVRSGDVIVAPSRSAAGVITRLTSALDAWVYTIHHPIKALDVLKPDQKRRPVRIVTLGRIVQEKAIHRQIEALDILVKQYGWDAEMIVAGELTNFDTGLPSAYARSLKSKAMRLGLEDRVIFPGVIKNSAHKANLLASADLMLYLSTTLEESFPKSAVEALAAGIPVVASNWDGFPEIVKECGGLVDLVEMSNGTLDILPDKVAAKMDQCLKTNPGAWACTNQAEQFNASFSEKAYRQVIATALQQNPSQDPGAGGKPERLMSALMGQGMLSSVPFLANLTLEKALAEYLVYAGRIRLKWQTGGQVPNQDAGYLTDGLVAGSLKKRLEHHYGNLPYAPDKIDSQGMDACLDSLAILERITACALLCEDEDSINAGLIRLSGSGETQLLFQAIQNCNSRGMDSRTLAYARIRLSLAKQLPKAALTCFQNKIGQESFQEHEWPLIRLLKQITAQLDLEDQCLPVIENWLARYPDSPGSGLVWLDHAVVSGAVYGWDAGSVMESLNRAEALLGPMPEVTALKGRAYLLR